MHPHRAEAIANRKHRVKAVSGDDEARDRMEIARAVHEHESHMHKGEPKTKIHLARGGRAKHEAHEVEGKHSGGRMDRARGGKAKAKGHKSTKINIINAPGGGAPRPVPVPVPMRGPGGPPMGAAPAMPPRPMPPPGGAPVAGMGPAPGGMPPGGLPPGMIRKSGGRTHKKRAHA